MVSGSACVTMPPWEKQRPYLNRITSPGRGAGDFRGARQEEAEIAFLAAMQMPILE